MHGRQLVCGDCGADRRCHIDSVFVAPDLNGTDRLFGQCDDCRAHSLEMSLDRHAVALVLGLDNPDISALDGIRVERFHDRSWATPREPNPSPWSHLDKQALARQVERTQTDLQARQGGPCAYCGITVTPPSTGWSSSDGRPRCGSCTRWLAGRDARLQRSIAASVLLGRSTATSIELHPFLGSAAGLIWFSESGRTEGATYPWAHINLAALRERAEAQNLGWSTPVGGLVVW